MIYNDLLLQYFNNPPNVGTMNASPSNIGVGKAGSEQNGDLIVFYIDVDEQNQIKSAKFNTYGNPFSIAVSAYLTEKCQNLSMSAAKQLDYRELVAVFAIPPMKVFCAIAAIDALNAAINDVESKRGNSCQK